MSQKEVAWVVCFAEIFCLACAALCFGPNTYSVKSESIYEDILSSKTIAFIASYAEGLCCT